MTYDILEWRRATAEYREQLRREKRDELLASIQEPTRKEVEDANRAGDIHAMRTLWETEEYNGVRNPTWDDPIWRDKSGLAGADWLLPHETPRSEIPRPAPRPEPQPTKTDIQRVREAIRARA